MRLLVESWCVELVRADSLKTCVEIQLSPPYLVGIASPPAGRIVLIRPRAGVFVMHISGSDALRQCQQEVDNLPIFTFCYEVKWLFIPEVAVG